MTAYTLTADTGSFALTGNAAHGKIGMPVNKASFTARAPTFTSSNGITVSMRGTKLLWRNSKGQYKVVLP